MLNSSGSSFCVEAFHIALGAGLKRGFNINGGHITIPHNLTGGGAELALGSDKGSENNDTRIKEKPRDFGDTANVFLAVLVGKAEVAIQTTADIVAIENLRHVALFGEFALQRIG